MTGAEYRAKRIELGYTQQELADLLGLSWGGTICRREIGGEITAEMEKAINSLPPKRVEKAKNPSETGMKKSGKKHFTRF